MLHYVDEPLQRVVVSVGPIIGVLIHVCLPILIYTRRRRFPLNRRSLGLFFASNVAAVAYLTCIYTILSTAWSPPCLLRFWPHSAFVEFFIFLILFRSIMLLFKYKLDGDVKRFQLRSAQTRSAAAPAAPISCFARNRRFLVGRPRLIISVAVFAFLLTIWLIVLALSLPAEESLSASCEDAPVVQQRMAWIAKVLGAALVGSQFIFVVIIYRSPTDTLGARFELLIAALLANGTVVFNWIMLSQSDTHDYLRWTVVSITMELVSAVHALWPLYLSYKFEQQQRNALQRLDSAKHLRDVLALSEGFAAYLQFASLEFSGERPLFWQTAGEFVASVSRRTATSTAPAAASDSFASVAPLLAPAEPVQQQTRARIGIAEAMEFAAHAQLVFDRFLAPNAPFHVRIPSSVRQPLELKLRALRDTEPHELSVSLTIAQQHRPIAEQGWSPSLTRSPSASPPSVGSLALLQRLRELATAFEQAREFVLQEMHESDFDRFLLSRSFAQLTLQLSGSGRIGSATLDESRAHRFAAAGPGVRVLVSQQDDSLGNAQQDSISAPAAVRAIADPSRMLSLEASLTGVLVAGSRNNHLGNTTDGESREPLQLPGELDNGGVAT